METKIVDSSQIALIVDYLKAGKVVAFPTDTVYGLGIIYHHEAALKALKQAKGRAENKPIPTMVNSYEQLMQCLKLNDVGKVLMKTYMPGALTLIGPKKNYVPNYCTNNSNLVAVRYSNDSLINALINACGCPLLVSSANLTNHPPCLNSEEVQKQLAGKIALIVEGEATGLLPSTIVDISKQQYKIIRVGPISENEIEKLLCYTSKKEIK